jgi:adenylate cyclase
MASCVVHYLAKEFLLVKEHASNLLKLSLDKGFNLYQAWGRIFLGRAQVECGQVEAGLENICRGWADYQGTGQKTTSTLFLAMLAEAYDLAGETSLGLDALDQAFALMVQTKELFYEAELHRLKGELLLQQAGEMRENEPLGEDQTVENCFRRALLIARRQSSKSLELRAALSLCRLLVGQGKRNQAREILAVIHGWFTEGFDTLDLREASVMLEDLPHA